LFADQQANILDKLFRELDALLRFLLGHQARHLVNHTMALAPHLIKERDLRGIRFAQCLLDELDDGSMRLGATRAKALGEHQGARGLQDRIVRNRVRPVVIIRQVTLGGGEIARREFEQFLDFFGTRLVGLDASLLHELFVGHPHLRSVSLWDWSGRSR